MQAMTLAVAVGPTMVMVKASTIVKGMVVVQILVVVVRM